MEALVGAGYEFILGGSIKKRILKLARAEFSPKQAVLQCQTICKLKTNLPESKKEIDILLKMNDQQKILTKIFSVT